jgi:hypothetical protein
MYMYIICDTVQECIYNIYKGITDYTLVTSKCSVQQIMP